MSRYDTDLFDDCVGSETLPAEGSFPVEMAPFFKPEFARDLTAQFPSAEVMPKVYSNAGAYQSHTLNLENEATTASLGDALIRFHRFGRSPAFAGFVKEMTGERIDPALMVISAVVHEPGAPGLAPHVDHRKAGLFTSARRAWSFTSPITRKTVNSRWRRHRKLCVTIRISDTARALIVPSPLDELGTVGMRVADPSNLEATFGRHLRGTEARAASCELR